MILMNMTLNEINSAEKIIDVMVILERVCDHDSLLRSTVSSGILEKRMGYFNQVMLDRLIELIEHLDDPMLPILRTARDRLGYLLKKKNRKGSFSYFYQLCTVDEPTHCWIQTNGVKRVTLNGKSVSLKRAIWITSGKEALPKHQIFSTCGNKLCVNPEHCMLKPITGNKNTRRDVRRIETQPDLALINMPWV